MRSVGLAVHPQQLTFNLLQRYERPGRRAVLASAGRQESPALVPVSICRRDNSSASDDDDHYHHYPGADHDVSSYERYHVAPQSSEWWQSVVQYRLSSTWLNLRCLGADRDGELE